MSNSSNGTPVTEEQEIIALFSQTLLSDYILLSSAGLVLYDYLLTFPLELTQIWQGKINLIKPLFLLNRYFSLVYLCITVLSTLYKPATDTECQVSYYAAQVFLVFVAIAQNSIFTLRIFAIYERSWSAFSLLTIIGFVNIISFIWETAVTTTFAFPARLQIGPTTCNFNGSSSIFSAQLLSTISSVIFDALVVVLTVYRTGRLAIRSKQANIKRSLSYILLRDGVLYYVAIFLPSFIYVAMEAVDLKIESSNLNYIADDLITMSNAVQFVAINRLVLNLSHTANVREDSGFRSMTGFDPPVFASGLVLGNVGAFVRTGSDDFDDEEFADERDMTSYQERILDIESKDRTAGLSSDIMSGIAGSDVNGDISRSAAEIEEIQAFEDFENLLML